MRLRGSPPRYDELPDLCTVDQVRAYLRFDRRKIYRDVRSGVIPSLRFGKTIRIPKAWIFQVRDHAPELSHDPADRATAEESTITLMRLLSAQAETETNEMAVVRFLERWPTDPNASGIRSTLEKFRRTEPGLLSDQDLWLIVQHGKDWQRMKELLKQ